MSDTPRMDAVRDYTCPEIMYREGCRLERELAEARALLNRQAFICRDCRKTFTVAAKEAGEVGK